MSDEKVIKFPPPEGGGAQYHGTDELPPHPDENDPSAYPKIIAEDLIKHRVPGVHTSEGDPAIVDPDSETVEKDYVQGGYDTAEHMARAGDPDRTVAARYRAGARAIEAFQTGLDSLPSKGKHLLSEESRAHRKQKRKLSDQLMQTGSSIFSAGIKRKGFIDPRGPEARISTDLHLALGDSPQQRKEIVEKMREKSAAYDKSASDIEAAAGDEFDHAKEVARMMLAGEVGGQVVQEGKNSRDIIVQKTPEDFEKMKDELLREADEADLDSAEFGYGLFETFDSRDGILRARYTREPHDEYLSAQQTEQLRQALYEHLGAEAPEIDSLPWQVMGDNAAGYNRLTVFTPTDTNDVYVIEVIERREKELHQRLYPGATGPQYKHSRTGLIKHPGAKLLLEDGSYVIDMKV